MVEQQRTLSRSLLTSWILLNLIFSSVGLVTADLPEQTLSISPDATVNSGLFGKISYSLPHTQTEKSPMGAEPISSSPLQRLPLQPVLFLFALMAIGSIFGVYTKNLAIVPTAFALFVVAVSGVSAWDGCCTHPAPGYEMSICVGTNVLDCCGPEDASDSDWVSCNATFAYEIQDCFDPATPVPGCQEPAGCCVYDTSCSDVQYKAQCDGDYRTDQACSSVPECVDTCCKWNDSDSNHDYCDFVPTTACPKLNESSGFPSAYKTTHSWSSVPGYDSQSSCESECQNIVVGIANITGYVNDTLNNILNETEVTLLGQPPDITDNSGYYNFTGIPSGYSSLKVYHPGYVEQVVDISLVPNETKEINFTLVPTDFGGVDGYVKFDNQLPAEGATVVISGIEGYSYSDTFLSTDNTGYFRFPSVPSGNSYSVVAYMLSQSDYNPSPTKTVSVSNGVMHTTSNLILSYRGYTYDITGNVQNYTGEWNWSSRRFNITARRLQGGVYYNLTSSVNLVYGSFTFKNVLPGDYELQAIGLYDDESSSIGTVSIVDKNGQANITVINITETAITQPNVNCADSVASGGLGGQACCLQSACPSGNNLGYAADCNYDHSEICCADSACLLNPLDTDGDGTPDVLEPLCMWEPNITSDDLREPTETNCTDRIDNDCSSTGLGSNGYDTNDEDEYDIMCSACGPDPCVNSSTNKYFSKEGDNAKWCNESANKDYLGNPINPPTLTLFDTTDTTENATYCSLCPLNEELCGAPNDCVADGGTCCSITCTGKDMSWLDDSCSSGVCCDNKYDNGTKIDMGTSICSNQLNTPYYCTNYTWQCEGGNWAADMNTVCSSPTGVACKNLWSLPNCAINEQFNATSNKYRPSGSSYKEPNTLTMDGKSVPVNATVCNCSGVIGSVDDSNTNFCCYDSFTGLFSIENNGCTVSDRGNVSVKVYNMTDDKCSYGVSSSFCYLYDDFQNFYLTSYQNGVEVNSVECEQYNPSTRPFQCMGSLPVGTYNMTVSADGWIWDSYDVVVGDAESQLKNVVITDGGITEKFAWLDKGIDCGADVPPPVIALSASVMPGYTNFSLQWYTNCDESSLVGFNLYKGLVEEEPSSLGNGPQSRGELCVTTDNSKLGRFVCKYNDSGPPNIPNEWNKSYNYTVEPLYSDNRIGLNSSRVAWSGDERCAGRTTLDKFCLNDSWGSFLPLTYSVYCNSNNLTEDKNCSTPNKDEVRICVGPYADGETQCLLLKECGKAAALADIRVPGSWSLGIFNNESNCNYDEDNNPNYCYWDTSNTVVDSCFNCSQTKTCYDYVSSDSCITDNCQARQNPQNVSMENGSCKWFSTWPEFGKGICYRENYSGTDQCYRCKQGDSPLLINPICTQDVCSLLGDCFSNSGNTSCLSCSEAESCDEYETKDSCEGLSGNSFAISHFGNLSSQSFSFSQDVCGLQRCKWYDGACFKDGNDNNKSDCATEVTPYWRYGSDPCRSDSTAPISGVTSYPNTGWITKEDTEIIISVSDSNFKISKTGPTNGAMVYWNLTNSSSKVFSIGNYSNATRTANSKEMKITLPADYPGEAEDMPQGDVILYYYARDGAYNVELVKGLPLFVDTIAPNITNVVFNTYDDPSSPLNSYTTVSFNTNEFADCSNTRILTGEYPPGITSDPGTVHFANFTGLYDGSYTVRFSCVDPYGNVNNSHTANFDVTRMGALFNQFPDKDITSNESERLDNIFTSTTLTVRVTTPYDAGDNVTCTIYNGAFVDSKNVSDIDDWSNYSKREIFAAYVIGNQNMTSSKATQDGGYPHWQTVTLNENQEYYYWVACINHTEKAPMAASYYFTVDTKGPITNLTHKQQSLWPVYDGSYAPQHTMRFNCYDPVIDSGWGVGEAGCSNITYCGPYEYCSPDTVITNHGQFTVDATQYVSWTSMDKLGNSQGEVERELVNVDSSSPTIEMLFPSDTMVTNESSLLINGSWFDNTDLLSIDVYLNSEFYSQAVFADNGSCMGDKCGYFNDTVDFDEGENSLSATAWDLANQRGDTDEFLVYYDLIPPTLNNYVMDGTVEYGDIQSLKWNINDANYTALTSQNNFIWLTILDNNSYFNDTFLPVPGLILDMGVDNTDFTYNLTPFINASGDYNLHVGNYTARFQFWDKFTNCELSGSDCRVYDHNFTVEDTTHPEGVINITNTDETYPGWLLDVPGTYNVEINLSESIQDNSLTLYYRWEDSPCGSVFIKNVTASLVNDGTFRNYKATIVLPDPEGSDRDDCLDGVDKGVLHFFAYDDSLPPYESYTGAHDRNGLEFTKEFSTADSYTIDNKGAGEVDFRWPGATADDLFIGNTEIYIGNTEIYNCGNNICLNLSGFADADANPNQRVDLYMSYTNVPYTNVELDGGPDWEEEQSIYSAPENNATDLSAEVNAFNRTINDSWVLINNNYIHAGLAVKFENHDRSNFAYYNILTSANGLGVYSSRTNITIDPHLEANVSLGESLVFYDDTRPTGWFQASFNLTNGSGQYQFYGYGTDNHGIQAEEPSIISIYYDNTTPTITSYIPYSDTVTNENRTNITVNLEDSGSGIELSSITLELITSVNTSSHNGTYTCDEGLICLDGDGNSASDGDTVVDVVYSTTDHGALDYQEYNATIEFNDRSGNENDLNWQFEVRTGIPSNPDMELNMGFEFVENGWPYWFIPDNTSLTGTLIFSEDGNVNVTDARMLAQLSANPSISKTSNTITSLTWNTALDEISHPLSITATKEVDNKGNWSSPITLNPQYITVDMVYPTMDIDNLVYVGTGYEDITLIKDDLINDDEILKTDTGSGFEYSLIGDNLSATVRTDSLMPDNWTQWQTLTLNYTGDSGTNVIAQYGNTQYVWYDLPMTATQDVYDISAMKEHVYFRAVLSRDNASVPSPIFTSMELSYNATIYDEFLATNAQVPTINGSFVEDNLDGQNNDVYPLANRIFVNYTENITGEPYNQDSAKISDGTWDINLNNIPFDYYTPERAFDMKFTICDKSGNCVNRTTKLLYDIVNPDPVILDADVPQSTWTNTDSVTFNWTTQPDYSGYGKFHIFKDGTSQVDDSTDGQTREYVWDGLTSGVHTFHVSGVDNAGNKGDPISWTLYIDNSPPEVTDVTIDPSRTAYEFTVSAVIVDEGEGSMDNFIVLVNGSQVCGTGPYDVDSDTNTFYFECFVDSFPNTDADLNVNVTVKDTFVGNIGYNDVNTIRVDTKAPVIESITNPWGTNQASVNITLTTDETANCSWGTNGASSFESMTLFDVSDSTTHTTEITLSANTDNTFYFKCRDDLGNTMNTANSTMVVQDNIPPALSGINYGPISYSTAITDYTTNSSVWFYGVSEQDSTIFVRGGISDVTYSLVDYQHVAVGLTQNGFNVSDFTVPVNSDIDFVSLMDYYDAVITTNISWLAACDTLSPGESCNGTMDTVGTYYVDYDVDTGSNTHIQPRLTITVRPIDNSFNVSVDINEGYNYIDVFSTDALGNENSEGTYAIYYDNSGPTVENQNPMNETTPDFTTQIKFDVNDGLASGVDWDTLDLTVTLSTGSFTDHCNNSGCDSGSINIAGDAVTYTGYNGWINSSGVMYYTKVNVTVDVDDNQGQNTIETWQFVVDNSTPITPIISFDGKSCDGCDVVYITNSTPQITVGFTEEVGIDYAQLYSTDVTLDLFSDNNMEFTLNSSDVGFTANEDTNYTFQLNATKLSGDGRMGYWSQDFNVDNTPPTDLTASFGTSMGGYEVATSANGNLLVTFNETNAASINITGGIQNNVNWDVSTSSATSFTLPVNLTSNDGKKVINVFVYDLAGNYNNISITVYLDSTAPTLSSWTITAGGSNVKDASFAEYGTIIEHSFTVSDPSPPPYGQDNSGVLTFRYANGTAISTYNVNFGTNETTATINISNDFNTQTGEYDIDVNNYEFEFNFQDTLGNAGTPDTANVLVNDTQIPVLSLVITDDSTAYPGWLLDTGIDYNLDITTSEALDGRSLNMSYIWADSELCNQVPLHYIHNVTFISETHYTAKLYIPSTLEDSCIVNVNEGTLSFEAVGVADLHGNVGATINPDLDYAIDTQSTKRAQFFLPTAPSQTVYVNGSEDQAGTVYGYSDEDHSANLSVELNLIKQDFPVSVYDEVIFDGWNNTIMTVASQEPIENTAITVSVTQLNRPVGSSWVIVDNTQLASGTYIKFASHDRETEQYYSVQSASTLANGNRNITITPSLESNVSIGDSLTVYDRQNPTGWFTGTLPLDLGEGRYYIYGYTYDNHNIRTTTPTWVSVVYDHSAPTSTHENPVDTTISSNPDQNISIDLSDSNSGLVLDSINMRIVTGDNTSLHNGTYTCADAVLSCLDDDGNNALTGASDISVVYNNGNLDYTTYSVYLQARDQAGNSLTTSWNFEIRTQVPGEPVMTLDTGYEFDENGVPTWFIPITANFNGYLDFPQDGNVNITDMTMLYQEGAEPQYTRASNNSYDLSFLSTLDSLEHMLMIEATKMISDTEWSTIANVSVKHITVDLVDPTLEIGNVNSRGIGTETASQTEYDLTASATITKIPVASEFTYELATGALSGSASSQEFAIDRFNSWNTLTLNYTANDGTVSAQYSTDGLSWIDLSSPSNVYDISSLPNYITFRAFISRVNATDISPVLNNMVLDYTLNTLSEFLATNSQTPSINGSFVDEYLDGQQNDLYPNANRILVSFTDNDASPADSGEVIAEITGDTYTANLNLAQYPVTRDIDLTIEACDKSGRCTDESTVLMYDTILPPPVSNLDSSARPFPEWTGDDSVSFTWDSPSDYSGIRQFLVYKDESTTPEIVEGTTYVWDSLTTGRHTFRVQAEDFAGNIGPESDYDFQIDITEPSVVIDSISPESTNAVFTISATLSDDEGGAVRTPIAFVNDSSDYCTLQSSSYPNFVWYCDVSSISDFEGTLDVVVTAEDITVGQVGSDSSTITVDTLFPKITDIEHVLRTNADSELVVLTVSESASCSWSNSDVAYSAMTPFTAYQDTTNPQTYMTLTTDMTYNYFYRCADLAGNVMTYSNTSSITRDTQAPPLENVQVIPIAWDATPLLYVTQTPVYMTGTSEQGTDFVVLNEGDDVLYTLDDRLTPTITLTNQGFNNGTDLITDLTVPVNSTITFTNTLSVTSTLQNIALGMNPMTITSGQSDYLTPVSEGTFVIEYEANGIPISNLTLTVRPISNDFKIPVPVVPGINFLELHAYDDLENEQVSSAFSIWYDDASPSIDNKVPANGSTTNNMASTIEFDVRDSDAGVSWSTFTLDVNLTIGGSDSCTCSGCSTGTINCAQPHVTYTGIQNLLNTPTQVYTPANIRVQVRDMTGQLTDEQWTFTLDNNTPSTPTITINDESGAGTLYLSSESPDIEIVFEERVEIISSMVDGSTPVQLTSSDDMTWTGTLPAGGGSFTYRVSAIRLDADDNTLGTTGTWPQDYEVDGDAPSNVQVTDVQAVNTGFAVVGSSPAWSTTDNQVTLSINFTESNPATLNVFEGTTLLVSRDLTGSSTTQIINLSSGDGDKSIRVEIVDEGDLSNDTTVTITVDRTGPTPSPELFEPSWYATSKSSVLMYGWLSADTYRAAMYTVNLSGATRNVTLTNIYSGDSIIGTYSVFSDDPYDQQITVHGNVCADANHKYLQPESEYSARYYITACNAQPNFNDYISILTLDEVMPEITDNADVYVYENAMPDGYFNATSLLYPGDNLLYVIAWDALGNTAQSKNILITRNENLELTLTLEEPSDYVINQADFTSEQYQIQVSTNYGATCTMSHPADVIAGAYTVDMTPSMGDTLHTYTFDSDTCTENGGNYCMIGGNYEYQKYSDRPTITCTAIDYDVASESITPCLTIATYTYTQGTEAGLNICASSTGCGTSTSGPTTSCRECSNYDGQQSTCEANTCFWCDDGSCVSSCNGNSCASSPLDYGDDFVCDASCEIYDNQSSCAGTGYCNWCDGTQTCSDSCSACTGFGLDYSGDGTCDADCNSFTGSQSACTASNYCKWCDDGNTCLSSCGSCGAFPADYGDDFVCDASCSTHNNDQSACQATSSCMWCDTDNTCGSSCSSCTGNNINYQNDYICDPSCDSHGNQYYSCINTNYCMWCSTSFSCGTDCVSCSTNNADYGNDQECDAPGEGNDYGFLT